MIKRFIRKISYFDTFGAEVKLNFNKRETHQSPFGGFCTILLVVVLSVIFVRGAISLINKEAYTVISNEVLNVDPPNRFLTSDNFMVALQADSPLKNSTKRLIDYSFIAYERVINENGTYDKNELSKFDLVKCTTDHFVGFDDSSLTNKFLKAQLPEYYCLPLNYNLYVQGTYKSDIFLYGKISIEICQANDCYSEEEIQQFYLEGLFNNFKINTIFLNRVSNLNQENNYITYLHTDFYVQAQIGLKTSTNIFLQEQVLAIDNSFIPGFSQIDTESIFSVELSKLIPLYESTQDLTQVSSFYIRLSQTQSQFSKTFYRFDELISYVGGITKFLATLLGYFILRYNQTGLQIKLANSLYQFDMPEKKKNDYVYSFKDLVEKVINSMKSMDDVLKKFQAGANRVLHMTKVASAFRFQSHPTFLNDNNDQEEIQPIQTYRHQYGNLNSEKSVELQQESDQTLNLDQDKKKHLDTLIKIVLEGRKKLSFGVHFIVKQLSSSFKKDKNENYQGQLFQRSTKMILRDMDILVMMSKLQEIEKIKHVLLNKTQRKVFNYLPKPVVSIQKERMKTEPQEQLDQDLLQKKQIMMKKNFSQKSLLGGRTNFNTLGKFKTLYEAYETIALSDTREEQEAQINERLIELVEPTIKLSFNSLVELEKLSRQIRNNKKRRGGNQMQKNRVQIMEHQQEIGENAQEDDMDCITLKGSHSEKNTHRSPQSNRSFQNKIQLKTASSNRQQQEVKLTKVQSKQDLMDIDICSS